MKRKELTSKDPVVKETVALPQLVDQVTEGHARIVVTRDGEPKAALVSLEEYARLREELDIEKTAPKSDWAEWSRDVHKLREDIRASRGGEPIDLDKLIRDM